MIDAVRSHDRNFVAAVIGLGDADVAEGEGIDGLFLNHSCSLPGLMGGALSMLDTIIIA